MEITIRLDGDRSARWAGSAWPGALEVAFVGWLGLLRVLSELLEADEWLAASAGGVGGELDPVAVTELLEHVLEVGRDGAS